MTTTQNAPWKLWNGYGPLPNGNYAVARIGPPGGQFDGLVGAEGHDIIGIKEALEYVVLAVNSHAALVEAVRQALVNCSIDNHVGSDDFDCQACNQFRAAIAAAKGRTP